jgi:hypothetical protein
MASAAIATAIVAMTLLLQPERRARAAVTSCPASSNRRAQARAQEYLVFGDHDAHGSSTVSLVPMPGALSRRRVPP